MLTVAEAFTKFKSRLEIRKTEQDDARRRQCRIREQVSAEMDVRRDFLTGSYARHTKTKPLKDVDIFVVLNDSEVGYLDRPPIEILRRVRAILVPHYDEDSVTTSGHSVRVDFGVKYVDDVTEEVVSFDVVPAFDGKVGYRIPDRDRDEWIGTDPEVHAQKATDANEAFSDEWKPVVKMIKKWNDHHDKPVKPAFLLEVMALDLVCPPWGGSYPRELRQFFASATDRLHDEWPDPAKLGPPVSDRIHSDAGLFSGAVDALRAAEQSCTEALRLEREGKVEAALNVWRDIFGPLFPKS